MSRDLLIALIAAMVCHTLVLFGFRLPPSPPALEPETYVEVSLIASAPEPVVAAAPQIATAPVTPIAFPEPIPEPEPEPEPKPEPEPEPIIEPPKKEDVVIPQEPPKPPIQTPEVQVTNAPVKTAAPASQNISSQNSTPGIGDAILQTAASAIPEIAASYIRQIKPTYPSAAKRLKQEGLVIVAVYISASGKIDKAEILESSGFSLLDEAALDAAKRSRMRPAYIGNRPINSKVEVPYRFVLKE